MREARPEQESTAVPQAGRRTIPPTLFLGMGGTGTEVVALLKQRFDLRRQEESDRRDLDLVRYFAIDTHPYEDLTGAPRGLQNIREYSYIGGFVESEYIERHYAQESEADLVDWWDPRYRAEYRVVDEGAGANRPLGRLCLYRSRGEIAARLRATFTELNAAVPPEEGGKGAGRCELFLIVGLAGGTGSGIFLDLSYLAWREAFRAFGNTPPKVTAFMVLPFLHGTASQAISEWLRERIVANGAAFLEELEYVLQNPEAMMQQMRFDASSNPADPLAKHWRPFEYCYLVGNRVGKKGFRNLEEMYSYLSRSVYQLFMTPEQNYHKAILDNIRTHLHRDHGEEHDKPTAFSTFGLATVEYPAQQILDYLTATYGSRLITEGFLYKHQAMKAAARDAVSGRKTESEPAAPMRKLAEECGGRQLSTLRSNLNRIVSEAEAAFPGTGGLIEAIRSRLAVLSDHVKALRGQYKEAVDQACARMKEVYDGQAREALGEVRARLRELVATERGSLYWRRHLIEALEQHFGDAMAQIRADMQSEEGESSQADADSRGERKQKGSEEYLLSSNKRQAEAAAQAFVQNLERHARARLLVLRDRLCESFLLQLGGPDPKYVVQTQREHGIVTDHRLAQSLLAEGRSQLDELISQAEKLQRFFDDEQRLERFAQVERGGEQATLYVPHRGTQDDVAKNKEVRAALTEVLEGENETGKPKIVDEVAAVSKLWKVEASAILTDPDGIRQALRQAIADRVGTRFGYLIRRSIHDLIKAGGTELRERVLDHLAGFASPCADVDQDALPGKDRQADIPSIWSLGTSPDRDMRDELQRRSALLTGLGALADVGTRQISVLYTKHGFPLFTLRGLDDTYRTYNDLLQRQYYDPAVVPDYFPHVRADWNTSRGVPCTGRKTYVWMVGRSGPETTLLFLTGLVLDEMLRTEESADKIRSVLQYDPARLHDRLPLRGFVFRDETQNGRYCACLLRRFRSGGKILFEPAELVALGRSRALALTQFEGIEASARNIMKECRDAVAEAMGGEDAFKQVLADRWVGRIGDLYGQSHGQPKEDRDALEALYQSLRDYVGAERLGTQPAFRGEFL
jgi:hypothetical protein